MLAIPVRTGSVGVNYDECQGEVSIIALIGLIIISVRGL